MLIVNYDTFSNRSLFIIVVHLINAGSCVLQCSCNATDYTQHNNNKLSTSKQKLQMNERNLSPLTKGMTFLHTLLKSAYPILKTKCQISSQPHYLANSRFTNLLMRIQGL